MLLANQLAMGHIADGRDGARYRQFLVNVIVVALTRRLMDLVSY